VGKERLIVIEGASDLWQEHNLYKVQGKTAVGLIIAAKAEDFVESRDEEVNKPLSGCEILLQVRTWIFDIL
jgi:hypothetical protein